MPTPPTPFGAYVETVQYRRLLFLTGMLPVVNHNPKYAGRLGKELDAVSGRDALYTVSMNALSAAHAHLGTLDEVMGGRPIGILTDNVWRFLRTALRRRCRFRALRRHLWERDELSPHGVRCRELTARHASRTGGDPGSSGVKQDGRRNFCRLYHTQRLIMATQFDSTSWTRTRCFRC